MSAGELMQEPCAGRSRERLRRHILNWQVWLTREFLTRRRSCCTTSCADCQQLDKRCAAAQALAFKGDGPREGESMKLAWIAGCIHWLWYTAPPPTHTHNWGATGEDNGKESIPQLLGNKYMAVNPCRGQVEDVGWCHYACCSSHHPSPPRGDGLAFFCRAIDK